ncbi:MAG: hypothetical protein K8T89_26860, partial [Planctomycetes bacterium]|nr:hypothetical protein [Planctomycetota bacterium]
EGRAIFKHFQILDADGNAVPDPWRDTELWNDDATRLTLWIHPGRIKKGVNLNEELGPVLDPDRRYTLVVDSKLVDDEGHPLAKSFRKEFKTIGVAKEALRLKDWAVKKPEVGTRDSLEVRLPRPLDRALLNRCVMVRDEEDKPLAGRLEIGKEERSWTFRPNQPWKVGEFKIEVDERLEDLAGNTIVRVFDFNRELSEVKDPVRVLVFRVGK